MLIDDDAVHCMIDIETLGQTPYASILSIGAVCFTNNDEKSQFKKFYKTVDLITCVAEDLEVDVETAKWWCSQDSHVRETLFVGAKPLSDVLNSLREYFKTNKVKYYWSHGATFDLVILESIYRKMFKKTLIPYKFARDTRTLEFITGIKYDKKEYHKGVAHNALDDAIGQTKWVKENLFYLSQQCVRKTDEV